LRCLGTLAGLLGFVAFAGQSFSVQPGFFTQRERGGNKAKLVLRYRQAASVSFHGL